MSIALVSCAMAESLTDIRLRRDTSHGKPSSASAEQGTKPPEGTAPVLDTHGSTMGTAEMSPWSPLPW